MIVLHAMDFALVILMGNVIVTVDTSEISVIHVTLSMDISLLVTIQIVKQFAKVLLRVNVQTLV